MMKRTIGRIGAACLLGTATLCAAAQEPPPPPKILQIYREDVKPGKNAAHEKVEAGWPRAFAKADFPYHYLALVSRTGPSEAWFVSGYPSFAEWEKSQRALDGNPSLKAEDDRLAETDGALLSGGRSLVVVYRDDLSRNANVEMSSVRYFRISTFRVRPGHDKDFTEAVKIVKGAYDKLGSPVPWAIFQVNAGMPGPTYLVWIPMRSLAESDAAMAASKSLMEAEGEEGQKALMKAASDGYINIETNIFSVNPKMSYPPKEWVAKDPGFWAPKPTAVPAKKEAAKPAEKK
ncbi:MAG: hypothetical protein ACHQPI_12710 [Thermoanaerobaculia bacterium]